MSAETKLFFAPQLIVDNGVRDISFYANAFGASENFCFFNEDGSIHVAELSIGDALFQIHEISKPYLFSPGKYMGTTAIIGLIVENVEIVIKNALAAGAHEVSQVKDYEYGYRQGEIVDPFGHHWLIQKKL